MDAKQPQVLHVDGCEPRDREKLLFDDEDFVICEHGCRSYGWRSVAKDQPDVDSSQSQKVRADFRQKWIEEMQGKVLGKKKRSEAAS